MIKLLDGARTRRSVIREMYVYVYVLWDLKPRSVARSGEFGRSTQSDLSSGMMRASGRTGDLRAWRQDAMAHIPMYV